MNNPVPVLSIHYGDGSQVVRRMAESEMILLSESIKSLRDNWRSHHWLRKDEINKLINPEGIRITYVFIAEKFIKTFKDNTISSTVAVRKDLEGFLKMEKVKDKLSNFVQE